MMKQMVGRLRMMVAVTAMATVALSAVTVGTAAAATPQAWTAWQGYTTTGCWGRTQVPYINVNGQVVAQYQMQCPTSKYMTVRGRIRSDRTLTDVTVASNTNSPVLLAAGVTYTWVLGCSKTSTRVTHGYHSDLLFYPGSSTYGTNAFTISSGSATLSPYCAN